MNSTERRKIWQHEDYQCPILGTCLSMAELRKLARKLGVSVRTGATDYELHAFFVNSCRREGPLPAFVHKYLDKKYRTHLRLFAKASEETTLRAMWRSAVKNGDIPGALWALMSHPATGKALRAEAFGEIHMLSHLMGAANRADLKRLAWLEKRLDEMTRALAGVQAARRARKLEWARRVRELEGSLASERAARVAAERNSAVSAAREAESAAERRLQEARRETLRQAAIIEDLYRRNTELNARLEDTQADLERAEAELVRLMPCAEGGGCGHEGACRGGDCLEAHAAAAIRPDPHGGAGGTRHRGREKARPPVAREPSLNADPDSLDGDDSPERNGPGAPGQAAQPGGAPRSVAESGPGAVGDHALAPIPPRRGPTTSPGQGCACGGSCGLACACKRGLPCPGAAREATNVLYVGGRCNLVRHYRELVERQGCRFHHHDGGREHSIPELYGKLASADVVLCPMDCVSHEACQSVKKACRHCLKRFVPLRSSGLSSLARSLDEIARRTG